MSMSQKKMPVRNFILKEFYKTFLEIDSTKDLVSEGRLLSVRNYYQK